MKRSVKSTKRRAKTSKLFITAALLLIFAGAGAIGWQAWKSRAGTTAGAAPTVRLANGESYDLRASAITRDIAGKPQRMLAYNGSIPGPMLEVNQDSAVTINFTNKLDTATAVHFHGIRADNASDGVVGVTQQAVQPGSSFSYKLAFPDPGVYWYHPHLREDATQPLGLYGTVIVKPKQAAYWSPVNKEVPLMVGDVLMENGRIVGFDKAKATYTLMGRFGNTMLVNGTTSASLYAAKGETQRYYITNVASTRPFRLAIPGAVMKLVGGDSGKYEQESIADSVTLGPSERAVVDVLYPRAGAFTLQNQTPDKTYKLAAVSVADKAPRVSYASQFNTLRTNADTVASIDPFRASFAKPADKSLTLTVSAPVMQGMTAGGSANMPGMDMGGMNSMPGMDMGSGNDSAIEWEDAMPSMNKTSDTESVKWKLLDPATGKENNAIGWQFSKGQKVKLSIYNDPNSPHPMQHPIHLHGQRFLVTSINGKQQTNLTWKDTVLVGKGDRVEVLVDMSNPGTWLIHCHIPEHMESGMTTKFTVSS